MKMVNMKPKELPLSFVCNVLFVKKGIYFCVIAALLSPHLKTAELILVSSFLFLISNVTNVMLLAIMLK